MRAVMHARVAGCLLAAVALAAAVAAPASGGQAGSGLRFVVTLDPALPAQPPGRLLLVMVPGDRRRWSHASSSAAPEPRAVPTLGIDAPSLAPGSRVTVGAAAAAFPIETLRDLPAGDYRVQAVLATNRDIRRVDAAGNLYSDVRRVDVDPARPAAIDLRLTRRIPDERLPTTPASCASSASAPSACPRSTAAPSTCGPASSCRRATTRIRRGAIRCGFASAATARGTPGCGG